MTVYVDNMRARYGRMIMCHMWSDSRDELFEMVDKIGVERRWIQMPPKASWEHFDISMTKRKLAVENGAVETDKYGPVLHVAKTRGDFVMVARIGKLRGEPCDLFGPLF